MRRWLWGSLLLLGVVGAVVAWRAADAGVTALAEAPNAVPTVVVARGDLDLDVFLRGDLQAVREMSLTAPAVGGTLRILEVTETGTPVREGDVIMTFDPAEQQFALDQALSEVREAEQEIIKRKADSQVQAAADEVALLTARFDVRRAELEAAVDAELISANEYRIRQVSLTEAKRNLEQVEQDVESRRVTSRAALTVLEEKKTKAQLTANRAQQNIDSLALTAPMDGIVAVRDNPDAAGGPSFGASLPPFRVGDSVFSGRPVIDVYDISGMEVRARVNEQERANVAPEQPALVAFDGLGITLSATVTNVAGLGRADRLSGPLRLFDVTLRLDETDPRLRPGTSVQVTVKGKTVSGVLLVPRQALFEEEGKTLVYVAVGDAFEPREVQVIHRTESRAAVEGLDDGTVIALVDPGTLLRSGASGSSAPPIGGGL